MVTELVILLGIHVAFQLLGTKPVSGLSNGEVKQLQPTVTSTKAIQKSYSY